MIWDSSLDSWLWISSVLNFMKLNKICFLNFEVLSFFKIVFNDFFTNSYSKNILKYCYRTSLRIVFFKQCFIVALKPIIIQFHYIHPSDGYHFWPTFFRMWYTRLSFNLVFWGVYDSSVVNRYTSLGTQTNCMLQRNETDQSQATQR